MSGRGETADPALMELFRAELDTHLPVLGDGLLALEKDGHQPRLLEGMMRAAHSIKGAARIVGVDTAVQVAHVMEDCLVAAQKGQVGLDAEAIDVLLRGVDFLSHVGKPAESSESPGPDFLEELVQAIAAVQNRPSKPVPEPSARETREAAKPPAGPPPAPIPLRDITLRPENLDRAGADQLRQQLLAQRQKGVFRIYLDLSAVRDMDPAALALLALFARLPGSDGNAPRLHVIGAAPALAKLLRLTRLDVSYPLRSGQES
jgi:chemotaxis protein histidine kinase CheA